MVVHRFEDLVVWQLSRDVVKDIYISFSNCNDYSFRDQIQRAAISIMNNVAEGFNKHKNTNDNKLFANFLNISYGSCGEVKSMLYVVEDLNLLKPNELTRIREKICAIEQKLENLIQVLKTKDCERKQK